MLWSHHINTCIRPNNDFWTFWERLQNCTAFSVSPWTGLQQRRSHPPIHFQCVGIVRSKVHLQFDKPVFLTNLKIITCRGVNLTSTVTPIFWGAILDRGTFMMAILFVWLKKLRKLVECSELDANTYFPAGQLRAVDQSMWMCLSGDAC